MGVAARTALLRRCSRLRGCSASSKTTALVWPFTDDKEDEEDEEEEETEEGVVVVLAAKETFAFRFARFPASSFSSLSPSCGFVPS